MGQLNFVINGGIGNGALDFPNGTLFFSPLLLHDSLSVSVVNVLTDVAGAAGGTRTVSVTLGFYSLNGSTLSSFGNIFSRTRTGTEEGANPGYLSMATDANNLSPGTWFFGLLASSSGNNTARFRAFVAPNAANAFPGGFIGGAMTDTTNALPSSIATSNLDITGADAIMQAIIILSA